MRAERMTDAIDELTKSIALFIPTLAQSSKRAARSIQCEDLERRARRAISNERARNQSNQSIRRGSFQSVSDLKRQIKAFVDNCNQHPKPFKWTATVDSILAKLERICKVINGTQR